MDRLIRFRIPADRDGQALVDFLALRFPYRSREEWCSRIAENRLRVNEAPADAAHLLRSGDVLEYVAHDIPEPSVRTDIEVVHADADLLIVNKPPNLPCHPGGRFFNHTLWAILKDKHGVESPSFVNRLDRETSGLVLVARNDRSAKACRAQFARRQVHKGYIAIVEGLFPDTLTAKGMLMPDVASPVGKRRVFRPMGRGSPAEVFGAAEGEFAETSFRRLRSGNGLSEVEAVLRTGRTHQIRATLHSVGFPVAGDKLYGVDQTIFLRFCKGTLTEDDRRRLRLDRQALHAASLRFRHPGTGKDLRFEVPPPADMTTLLQTM